MLVLSREKDQSVMIGDNVEVMVVDVRGPKVLLGFRAPRDVPVFRNEIFERMAAAQAGKSHQ